MHNHPDSDKSFCILQRSYRNIYFFIYPPDGDKSLCACAEGDITYFYFIDHPEGDKSLCALKAIQFISFIDLRRIPLPLAVDTDRRTGPKRISRGDGVR